MSFYNDVVRRGHRPRCPALRRVLVSTGIPVREREREDPEVVPDGSDEDAEESVATEDEELSDNEGGDQQCKGCVGRPFQVPSDAHATYVYIYIYVTNTYIYNISIEYCMLVYTA